MCPLLLPRIKTNSCCSFTEAQKTTDSKMSEASSPTPLKQRTCGFCLFKLPTESSFIGNSGQTIFQGLPGRDGEFWVKYIQSRDDWINRQLELNDGDLRVLGHRECDTCSGNRGCGWCISNFRSTIPLLREGMTASKVQLASELGILT